MIWIAPSEKDTDNAALEKRLWDAADQFRVNSGLKSQEYSAPFLGLIFLLFARSPLRRQARQTGISLTPRSRSGTAWRGFREPESGIAHQDRRAWGPGLQSVGPVPPPGAASERAGGEGYAGDPARELSIHGVEKTDETGLICQL